MTSKTNALQSVIENELAKVDDERIVNHVKKLLVPPTPQRRAWDYGEIGQTYECWIVLADKKHGTAIAHCNKGLGQRTHGAC